MLHTIESLEQFKISRPLLLKDEVESQTLYGYADASDIAISIAIYLVTKLHSGELRAGFVTGISRVIPTGTFRKGSISIPRAELCAAQLLSKTMLQVEHDLGADTQPAKSKYFTDSEDVMSWLRNDFEKFPKYVTTRRNYILKVSKVEQWSWLPGLNNPADIGTRPITVPDLL